MSRMILLHPAAYGFAYPLKTEACQHRNNARPAQRSDKPYDLRAACAEHGNEGAELRHFRRCRMKEIRSFILTGAGNTNINVPADASGKGIRDSMRRKGNCLDNGCYEKLFALLKRKLIYLQNFESVEYFQRKLIEYRHCNNRRMKAKLKGLPSAIHRRKPFRLLK